VEKLEWELKGHLNLGDQHVLKHVTTYKGKVIAREVVTRYNQGGTKPGKSNTFYYIEGRAKEYKTLKECMDKIK